VILGLRVRIKEAEYPDQNPWRPFSERIDWAISDTEGEVVEVGERAEIMDAVCFRVTMLEIGVVKNLEHAPASAPTVSSSSTGKVVVFVPFFCSRLERR